MATFRLVCTAFSAMAVLSVGVTTISAAENPPTDTAKIATEIKADMAQLVADFNARDASRVASHDAPNIVQMVHGNPNIIGAEADLEADRQQFAADPTAHTLLSAENVEVAGSGDLAVYRATYKSTFTASPAGKPMTQEGNYVAVYKLQPNGSWKIEWAIAASTGSSRPATP
jgi:ketosteroid isomerase-like protein